MNKELELKNYDETLERLERALAQTEEEVERIKTQVKEYRGYINDQYLSMDVKELRENVDSAGNLGILAEGHQKKAHTLSKLVKNPYFAKIKFTDDVKGTPRDIYIGTGGFFDEEDCDMRIFDWRAPISELYYNFETGRGQYQVAEDMGRGVEYNTFSGNIDEKLQFKIKDGKIAYMADTSLRVADELLLESLSGNAAEKMKPVVATIQKEQNDIIRDLSSKVLVVDGRAGSGKSVIAMHRLAWLLYNKRKTLNAGNVMVLSPNKLFSDYISGIMPELCDEEVSEKQWDDLMDELVFLDVEYETKAYQADTILTLPKDDIRLKMISLKNSVAYFDALTAYIEEILINGIQFRDFHYEKLTITKEQLEKYFFKNFNTLPPYERFYNIAYFILEEYMDTNKKEYAPGRSEKVMRQIQNLLINSFASANVVDIYKDFLSVVDKAYPGAANYLNDQKQVTYEDMQAIFYLQIALYGCNTYKDLKHVIVDEMQDYSVFQFAIMDKIFGGNKTILGDSNQVVLSETEENVLDALIRVFPERTIKVLTKTYRSTKEIADFCSEILGDEGEAESFLRHGEKPVVKSLSHEELKSAVLEMVKKYREASAESIAILCDDEGSAFNLYRELNEPSIRYMCEGNAAYRGGSCIMSRFLSKGMEFDACIVVTDKSLEEIMANESEKHAYYISCTRALHHLCVFAGK